MKNSKFFEYLNEKVNFIRKETLKLHLLTPETRIASSLSCIEIFVVLYYSKIFNFFSEKQGDKLVISKGHGSISLYPILYDLGFIRKNELENISKENSVLGSIPDISLPTIDLINGSLGHGLGQACGIALGLKRKKINSKVIVLIGDGELYEGSVWEAVMFAFHHKLDNIIAIIDNNKISMLDYCKNIINIEPIKEKFSHFGWLVKVINGHDIYSLYQSLYSLKYNKGKKPKVLIAETVKGKGVPSLEKDPLCHIRSLKKEEILLIINGK
ncbi:MAG: transketolase [Candidatus Ratteibacteria bacterium]